MSRQAEEPVTLKVTAEELGWILFACRAARKKDDKGAARFGDALDPRSSIANRVRVGKTAHANLRLAQKGEWDKAVAEVEADGS